MDQGDEAGRTPLALAALRGHADCVHTLLSQGASPHAVDTQYGRSAVHLAGRAQPWLRLAYSIYIYIYRWKALSYVGFRFGFAFIL